MDGARIGKTLLAVAGVAGAGVGAWQLKEYKQKMDEETAAQEKAAAEAAAKKKAAEERKVREAQEAAARAKAEKEAEEARIREQEAQEAAAREKAAEERRQELSATLETATAQASETDGIEPLREALAAAKSGLPAGSEVIVAAEARLGEIELTLSVADARQKHSAGMANLEQAFLDADAAACRQYIGELVEVNSKLVELQQGLPEEGADLISRATEFEQKVARKEAALQGLESAVQARHPLTCAQAIEEATAAGVEPCPVMELATILSDPERLYTSIVRDGAERVAELRKVEGLRVADFAAAAEASTLGSSEEQLQTQVVDLVRTIITNHRLYAEEMDREAHAAEATVVARCAMRMDETIQHFHSEKSRVESEKREALAAEYRQFTEEEVTEALNEIYTEAEAQRRKQQERIEKDKEERLQREHERMVNNIAEVLEPLSACEELVRKGQSLQQRSQASGSLSVAALALEEALVEGRPSHVELQALQEARSPDNDGFVAKLLDQLPADSVEWSSKPIATEPQLQRSFSRQLDDFVAAAFFLPAEGLLSNVVSGLTGKALARLYVLKMGATPHVDADDSSAVKAIKRNLGTLAQAAKLVENGNVLGALTTLESALDGPCRAQAETWMNEARQALLLHQTSKAIQAKARCLNGVLL